MTDADKVRIAEWFLKHVTYFEHGGRELKDGYWPQTAEDYDIDPESHYIGLSLSDYIMTRVEE